MTPRRIETAPVEIELIPLDAPTACRGHGDTRPSPAGAGTIGPLVPVVAASAASAVARVLHVDDPPLVRGSVLAGSWSDQQLHRAIRLAPWDAAAALDRVVRDHDGRIDEPERRGRRARVPRVARRRGTLVLAEPRSCTGPGPRYIGALVLPAPGRATRIELTLEPWSAHRSDLCLQPRRGRFGTHLPHRYYDVAHRVMDELWHLIERAAPRRDHTRRSTMSASRTPTDQPTHQEVVDATADTERTMRPQPVPVNVYETSGALVVLAPLPAVTADDVTIELDGVHLRFWAHLRSAGPRDYLVHEWDYGGYERMLDVPDGYGAGLEATLSNGQLAIRVLRGEATGPQSITPSSN